jgi:Zn-dependent protease
VSNSSGDHGGLPPEVEAELRRRAQAAGSTAEGYGHAAHGPAAPGVPPKDKQEGPAWLKALGPIGVGLAIAAGKLKFLLPLAKFGLPALKTGGTMLLSLVVYAQVYGWWFALGFVLSIFVHEMGHVFAAWRLGIPVSAPLFIPGFGALILQKQRAKSPWEEALIGIGGPVAGTLAALFCLLVYGLTGSPLMLALAFMGFFLNLFNLLPIFPLDGGWITGAISPRLWLVGILALVAGYAIGLLHNPLIIVLLLFSLPRLWKGLKTGDVTPEGGVPVTPRQRWIMGISYLSLCGLLLWLMAHTHVPV